VVALGVICAVVVLIIVVLVLVLRAAHDNKLGRFKFKISASLLKICTFGIEVESEREPAKLPSSAESTRLPPSEARR
jgi:energy-converting hydrogenase Eha subunit A